MTNFRKPPNPIEYGIFNIKIDYPEYTVVTPQTGLEYGVRSLSVSEVNRIKSSITTPSSAVKLMNEAIWSAIVRKPSIVKNFDDFMRLTTDKDREALLYGIYLETFGNEKDFTLTCRNCGTERLSKIILDNCFSINAYPGSESMKNQYRVVKSIEKDTLDPTMEEEIRKESLKKLRENLIKQNLPSNVTVDDSINELIPESTDIPSDDNMMGGEPIEPVRIKPKDEAEETESDEVTEFIKNSIISSETKVSLPVSKFVAVVFQPTLKDEDELLNKLPFGQKKQLDLLTETVILKRFELTNQNSELIKITSRMDIYEQYQNLPYRDKNIIIDAYRDNYGQYSISLSTTWLCTNCGFDNTMSLDLVTQFFRMVATS